MPSLPTSYLPIDLPTYLPTYTDLARLHLSPVPFIGDHYGLYPPLIHLPTYLFTYADLARLHLSPVPFIGDHYGFQHDNFLGMAPQKNEWMEDFSTFFLQRRLVPQLHVCR